MEPAPSESGAERRPVGAAPDSGVAPGPVSALDPVVAPGQGGAIWPILLVAAVAGAGTMVVELSAVRLLAPWFGTSASVWSNVIGVILLALALGYLLGARLAARSGVLRALAVVLALAGALALWLPALTAPVCRWFLPTGVSLHEAAELLRWGSLAASLVLFLPPALLLGTAGPLAVEAVQQRSGAHAGTAGGEVLAVSTLGSLAGTFATSQVLVPELGLVGTFRLAAALLVLASLAAAGLSRRGSRGTRRVPGVLALVVLAGASSLFVPARGPELPEGVRLLAAAESAYQSVRVVEEGALRTPADAATETGLDAGQSAGDDRFRRLQVNEGFDSFQSVWQPEPGLLPESYYYNDFALPPWFEDARGPWRVLVLGLGGGTAVRVLEGAAPEALELDVTGVELDPVVVRLARDHMQLPPEGTQGMRVVEGLDARSALHLLASEPAFDQVVLDCYANQVEIPPHLSSLEWFEELAGVLRPGGWLVVNTGGFGLDDPVVDAVAATLARAFAQPVLGLRVPAARNVTLFARRGDAPAAPGSSAWSAAPRSIAAALLDKRAVDGAWRLWEPGAAGTVLTDDRNPIALLQVRSIREGRARLEGRRP